MQASSSIDQTLAALSDPHRRRTVDLLRERPRRAGELAEAVGLAPPAMSRHLRVLRQSGLVEETHPDFDARVRVYTLRQEPMAELKAWLEETERLWTEQLAAFKDHIEGAGGGRAARRAPFSDQSSGAGGGGMARRAPLSDQSPGA